LRFLVWKQTILQPWPCISFADQPEGEFETDLKKNSHTYDRSKINPHPPHGFDDVLAAITAGVVVRKSISIHSNRKRLWSIHFFPVGETNKRNCSNNRDGDDTPRCAGSAWLIRLTYVRTWLSPSDQISGRVTRLGEFSPIRRMFTLASFFTITEVARIFWLLYSTGKVMNYFLQKIGLKFGHFFHYKPIWSPWSASHFFDSDRKKTE
jgi:hypothetical protein